MLCQMRLPLVSLERPLKRMTPIRAWSLVIVDSRHKGPIARYRTFETSSALVAELLWMGVGSAGGV